MQACFRLIAASPLAGVLLGMSPCFAGGVLAEHGRTQMSAAAVLPSGAVPSDDARLFAEVLQQVRENYVDPVDEHKLIQTAIRGMVESLDEHSTFMSTDQFEDMRVSTTGAYAGIGVEVIASKDGVGVVRRMPGSPAERAGIRAGDVIVRIDNVAVNPAEVSAAIERMRGAEGSPIRLAVRRVGTPLLLQFRIQRANLKLASVEAERLTGDDGYVRITSFTDSTARELEDAVDKLEHTGTEPLRGLVVDLRNNSGGVLNAATQIADDFLDRGTIVSAQGRTQEANFYVTAKPGDIARGAKLALLINGGSASAAEILAAALHDNGRATLIGRRTYGKGTVQSIMPLSNGTALKLTTSRYFTPAGVSINGIGIVPDIVLSGAEQLPADMDTTDRAGTEAPTLAQRDPQVARSLNFLSSHPSQLAGRAATGTAAR